MTFPLIAAAAATLHFGVTRFQNPVATTREHERIGAAWELGISASKEWAAIDVTYNHVAPVGTSTIGKSDYGFFEARVMPLSFMEGRLSLFIPVGGLVPARWTTSNDLAYETNRYHYGGGATWRTDDAGGQARFVVFQPLEGNHQKIDGLRHEIVPGVIRQAHAEAWLGSDPQLRFTVNEYRFDDAHLVTPMVTIAFHQTPVVCLAAEVSTPLKDFYRLGFGYNRASNKPDDSTFVYLMGTRTLPNIYTGVFLAFTVEKM